MFSGSKERSVKISLIFLNSNFPYFFFISLIQFVEVVNFALAY